MTDIQTIADYAMAGVIVAGLGACLFGWLSATGRIGRARRVQRALQIYCTTCGHMVDAASHDLQHRGGAR